MHLYNHEGIYLGDRRVIHVADQTNPVKEDNFKVFLGDNPLKMYFVNYLVRPKRIEEIISTARTLIGTRKGEYSLMKKNCQHFASLCACDEEMGSDLDIPIYSYSFEKSPKSNSLWLSRKSNIL